MNTRLLPTDSAAALEAALAAAVQCLRAGDPVALPTETVYGLAADALRADAVAKIFEAKERPFFDPLIVHLPDLDWLERVTAIPEESRALVEALAAKFWPGPLTLILPRRIKKFEANLQFALRGAASSQTSRAPAGPAALAGQIESPTHLAPPLLSNSYLVPDLVTAGLETVAVRMSAHPVFRAVCAAFGRPLAAPSANRFGRISPTAAEHVRSELGGRIPLILDGGPTEHGLESTIVKVEGGVWTILRAGPVSEEAVAATSLGLSFGKGVEQPSRLSARVSRPQNLAGRDAPEDRRGRLSHGAPEAPGQLASHYAPQTRLMLSASIRGGKLPIDPPGRCGALAFTPLADERPFAAVEILSPTGDLREAAASLFAKLRRLDEAGLDVIFAEPVPEYGLGIAIMDRLRKAAAEHVI